MTGTGRQGYRLVLDLQATQSPAHWDRGIARYVREQARALVRRQAVDALLLNPNLPFPKRLEQDLLVSPMLGWNTRTQLRRVAEAASGPLAYYLMSPFELSAHGEGDLPPHALHRDVPTIATLYDLIPLLLPERYLVDPDLARRYRARAELLHQLDLVLTISEHSRDDAVGHLDLDPARVVTIGAGVSPFFRPAGEGDDPDGLLRRYLPAIERPYVLTVSGGDPRKNTERLLEAWARVRPALRAEHQLVVSCNVDPATRRAWEDHAAGCGLAPGEVVLTGWVSDEVLRALYQRTVLAVSPPLYEGFGLPAAEAIACGAPAITSSTSSLPEVLDLPASTFDPLDVADMASAIERALDDDDHRRILLARGAERAPVFTWDAVADRTLAAVEDRLAPPATERTELPVRLALVGPMPPTPSGIADYNARLVPALARRAEVDVFTPAAKPAARVDDGVRWFPTPALGRIVSPWGYDAVVYTLGNSDDHHDLYELAQEFPGLLWLHDVRLPGLYLTYARDRVPEGRGSDFLVDRLRRQYRRRLPVEHMYEVDLSDIVTTPFIDAGLGITKELVDVARGVVVSSALAERLLHLDQQPDGRPPRSWVLPLGASPAHPASAATPAERGSAPVRRSAEEPLVVSLGLVSPAKSAELLVAGLAALRTRVPATLVFVGGVSDDYRSHLERLADTAGVGDHVRLTGHVPGDELERWLQEATLALQLRASTNGESSGAVLDALAAGLPVVTNVAAMAELPEGTVDLVPYDVGPRELAEHVAALLAAPGRLEALAAAGLRYASSWQVDDVADELLRIVAQLP